MSGEITPVPDVPKAIKDAVNNRTLAVFTGAGVSRIIGCDGWDILSYKLINKCFIDGLINFKEKESLLQIKDNKKKISISYNLFNNKNLLHHYYHIVADALKEKQEIAVPNIYDDIDKLRGLCITTNADTHMKRFRENHIHWKDEDFKKDIIDRRGIYHIHGYIRSPKSLVFTTPEYLKKYSNIDFKGFLENIFFNYTVLFLGYGLSEFEIIEFMIRDISKEKKHFMLSPFFSGESNILEFEQSYFDSFGIKVLAYSKDEKGYNQLQDVIKEWNKEINFTTDYLHNTYHEIEAAIKKEKPSENDIDETLLLIKNEESLKRHFLKQLTLSTNPSIWLASLFKNDYFNPEQNPAPTEEGYYIPHWDVLEPLESIAKYNENHPDDRITELLLQIINGIISIEPVPRRTKNAITNRYIVKVLSYLQEDKLDLKHISFIGEAVFYGESARFLVGVVADSFLPKLLKTNNKLLVLEFLKIILHYKKQDKSRLKEYTSIIEFYYFKEILDKNKKGIASLCAFEAGKIGLNKLIDIYTKETDSTLYIWIPAIENHEQNQHHDEYYIQLIQFIRDMFEASAHAELKTIIEEMIISDFIIIKRVAMHLLNHHYDEFNIIFWAIKENPLEFEYYHEVWELLKSNCMKFDKSQIDKVINWIESKDYYLSPEIKGTSEEEKIKAYKKKEWLTALVDSHSEEVRKKYDFYDSIASVDIQNPGFQIWSSGSGFVKEISPIEESDFKKMSNLQKANYIQEYKVTPETFNIDFTRINLASSFRKYIAEDPVSFEKDLKPFLSIPPKYKQEFFRGFEIAWRDGKDFDWSELILFMKAQITDKAFWEEIKEQGENSKNDAILGTISDLLSEGLREDKHAFNESLLSIAEEIVLLLLNNTSSHIDIVGDLPTAALNSTRGKSLITSINYSLRLARLYNKNKKSRWANKVKEYFNDCIEKQNDSDIEFWIILGWYLPNISFLDKKWIDDNFLIIFNTNNEKIWEISFSSLILTVPTVYEDLYKRFKSNGDYERALNFNFIDVRAKEHVIQHILLGYLVGWDVIDNKDSLIDICLNNVDIQAVSEIVHFMWQYRDKLNDKNRIKIKPLWQRLIMKLEEMKNEADYPQVLSTLGNWLCMVPDLDDDVVELMKASIKYIHEGWNEHNFVENLLLHVTKNSGKAGKLYLNMLEAGIFMNFYKDMNGLFVQSLYDNSEREAADRICNMYLEKGYDFLIEVYERNRKSGEDGFDVKKG